MARFLFRLKPLLALRGAARDERRMSLAESQAAHDQLTQRRTALTAELNEQHQRHHAATTAGRIDIERLQAADRYQQVLRREIDQIAAQEARLDEEIQRRREAVVESDREVRVLEKLSERQYEQFQREELLAETKQFDEAAASRRLREETA